MLRRIPNIHPSQHIVQKKFSPGELNFRHGEIIKGTVVRKYNGGELLVAAKGKQFRAFTTLNLMEGDRHRFQIKTVGSKIELKVLDGLINKLGSPIQIWSSNRIARSRLTSLLADLSKAHQLTGLTKGTSQALKNLHQLFPAIVFNDHGDNSSLWITRYIMGSGLFWENKILQHLLRDKNISWKRLIASDLKGLLLSLDKSLGSEDQDHDNIKSLIAGTRQALHLIEQDQFLNLSAMRDGLGWFLYIPGSGEDGFRKGELFVENSRNGEGLYFSIFLELTRLGQIVMDVSIIESVIGIKICAEDAEKANFVTENLPLLEKGLQGLRMTTGKIFCDITSEHGPDINFFSKGNEQSPSVDLVI